MPRAATPPADADAASTSSNWPDLPFDLLRDISCRFRAAGDYVRFHAVCKPWRGSLPPAPCRLPAFLPWLVAPRGGDATAGGRRKARCVLSSEAGRRAMETSIPDRRWIIDPNSGTASRCLRVATSCCPDSAGGGGGVADPFSGSAATISVPRQRQFEVDEWEEDAVGVASGDGTVAVYVFGGCFDSGLFRRATFVVALQRPGAAAWTFRARREHIYTYACNWSSRTCVACRGGRILLCRGRSCHILPIPGIAGGGSDDDLHKAGLLLDEHGESFWPSYFVDSLGELLWVQVQVDTEVFRQEHSVDSLARATSMSVYALQEEDCGEPRWVKRDGRSLADRVLFLGRPSSFAVDAARLGLRGGCAYFVDRRPLYRVVWSMMAKVERCRVFRCSFLDDRSEFVVELPEDWKDEGCMWITPQPVIATTEVDSEESRQQRSSVDGPVTAAWMSMMSVYALREEDGGEPRWVKKDGRSLADRVMFLGRPSSFAVDTALLGMRGGCAYFVHSRQLFGGFFPSRTAALERCRVFKGSFLDDRSEFVAELPEDWKDEGCMWITPPTCHYCCHRDIGRSSWAAREQRMCGLQVKLPPNYDLPLVFEMRRAQSLQLVLIGADMLKDLLSSTVLHQLLQAKLHL